MIGLDTIPAVIPQKEIPWLTGRDKRIATVSGFSFGWVNAHLAVDYDLAADFAGDHGTGAFDVGLKQAFFTLEAGCADIVIGKTIVRWGTGDGINPMDLINPVDRKDPISGARSDSRLPVWLLNGMADFGNFNFDVVFLPRGEVSGLPDRDSPWEGAFKGLNQAAAAGDILLESGDEPERWFTDSEVALKIQTNWKGVDLALIYYDGFSDMPFLRWSHGDLNPIVTPEYPRFNALGVAFANGFGKSTIRGELAVKHDLAYPGRDSFEPVKRDFYQGVFGYDYTTNSSSYYNVQLFCSMIGNGAGNPDAEWYAHGLTFEVHGLFLNDDLKAGVRGTAYTSDEGSSMEFFTEYQVGDALAIDSGIMVFEGVEGSTLGQYDNNDMLYLKVRYYF